MCLELSVVESECEFAVPGVVSQAKSVLPPVIDEL